MSLDQVGFTPKELRQLRSLKTPYGIQRYLITCPTTWETRPGRRAGCCGKTPRIVSKEQSSPRRRCGPMAFPP